MGEIPVRVYYELSDFLERVGSWDELLFEVDARPLDKYGVLQQLVLRIYATSRGEIVAYEDAETVKAFDEERAKQVLGEWVEVLDKLGAKPGRIEAARLEDRAREAMERTREEARRRLEPIIDKLAPEIRQVLEREPEKAWELGVLDKSCVYLRDHEEYLKQAEEKRRLAEELRARAQVIQKLRETVKHLLGHEEIQEAHKIAKQLLEEAEKYEPRDEW
ncbi:hypothetical protein PYJP_03990 [Pyrofollis japonicus]|uniref:hypothetical protein n=1 Tax=Pyrofollis japonicus TaxID=3060460 RepID=UPI00295C37AF|nr:hypothetical protein [Pyrofollis japonicus]BEP17047.1 hypothetical protein PYJP_03990 [Pyrofollis japonicus]